MRWLLMLAAAAAALALVVGASADEGDAAGVSVQSVRVGDHFNLRLLVAAPKDAQVDVLPGGDGWAGVEVLQTTATSYNEVNGVPTHELDLVVAAFTTGNLSFAPEVSVTQAGDTETRALPAVSLSVLSVLSAGDKLELSPILAPESIDGAQSPFLLPAIVLGGIMALVLAAMGIVLIALRIRRRVPAGEGLPAPLPSPSSLKKVEELLLDDNPVAGYRTMATTVRSVLGERYGIPAPALTTRELRRRMEAAGADRWQTRLVGGLLEECDAVVYAGYRPAPDRLTADLNMAREIVELDEPQAVSA